MSKTRGASDPSASEPIAGVPHRQLGRYLRDMREGSGLSIRLASKAIGKGAGSLQRLETGAAPVIHDEVLEGLCLLYDRPDMIEVLKALARQGREPNWWHQYGDVIPETFNVYVGLEAAAEKLRIYRPDLISGLFQTSDYARALDRLYFIDDTPDELERRIRVRRERQNLITRKVSPVQVELIVDEGVLRKRVGGPKVMGQQLRHLADMPPNVTVRILPDSAGFPLGIATGPFTIMDFGVDGKGQPLEPTTVYVESYTGPLYLSRRDSVRKYRKAFDGLQRVALSTVESKHLLRQVAKEYVP
ncbi:helix-turn-helix domain-containing protein [Nocardia sp. Marseille-Q1738]